MDYEFNSLSNIISQVTNTAFHHVMQKRQVNYIHSYLEKNFDLSSLKMIVEFDYVEENYLTDYADFFVKSHNA